MFRFFHFVVLSFLFPALLLAEQFEIHFVTWKPDPGWFWDKAIADFESENPAIKVTRDIGPNSSTDFHDLVTQKLKNRDPRTDVFFMDVIWPAEFASAGWARALDDYFPKEEQKKFLQGPILANTYEGKIYGVPVFVDAGLLYYRKDLLEKYNFGPPKDWPDLVRQAKWILAREHDPYLKGFSGQFKQYEGLVCDMMEYILGNGGRIVDERELKPLLDQPRAVEAVRFVRDEIIGQISHRGALSYQEPESLALFVQGRAIFHRNWPYAWKAANDPKTSKVAGKVGMMPLPGFPGFKGVAALGGWQLGISRFSRKPEAAWKFVSFLTGEKMQKQIALVLGRPPSRKAAYRDPEILKQNPNLEPQLEAFLRAVPRPTSPVYVPLSNILQRYFSSSIAVPTSNIPEGARLAVRDMDRVLDLLRNRPRL